MHCSKRSLALPFHELLAKREDLFSYFGIPALSRGMDSMTLVALLTPIFYYDSKGDKG